MKTRRHSGGGAQSRSKTKSHRDQRRGGTKTGSYQRGPQRSARSLPGQRPLRAELREIKQPTFVRPEPTASGDIRLALLTAPGLGPWAQREMEQRRIVVRNFGTYRLRNHDLVTFDIARGLAESVRQLRVVDDLFAVLVEGFSLNEPAQLKRLARMELKDKILNSLPLKGQREKKKRATDYWVFVKQDRDHEVYRHEVADVLVQNIGSSFSHWRAQEPADVEVWAFMIEGRLTAGVRLTDISFRQRKYRAAERPGALRPPIAAALVVMSNPAPEDRFIDPMCGTGTILCERALWGPTESIIGGDIDPEAVEIARQSFKIIDRKVDLFHWDATDEEALIENAAGATVLVCNLPFGKRFESSDLRALYKRALSAWRASLATGARMILLTSEREILRSAAMDVGLKARTVTVLTTQGLRATVFELRNGRG